MSPCICLLYRASKIELWSDFSKFFLSPREPPPPPGPPVRHSNPETPLAFSHVVHWRDYSRGQAKPTNPVSRSGVHLGVRFFQILTQIVEMNRKTHLRSFSHDVLAVARILDQKTATSGVKNRLKLAKNHQKLVPVLGFGWKLIRKGKEHIKKVFSCISEPSC